MKRLVNLGVFVRAEIHDDGSFAVKPWQLITLLHADLQPGWHGVNDSNPAGRWWFLVLRFPFLPRRMDTSALIHFQVREFRGVWCFPIVMWFKKPRQAWKRQKVEWSPYLAPDGRWA